MIDFFNHYSDALNSYYHAYIRKKDYVYDDFKYIHALRYKTIRISGLKIAPLEDIMVHIPIEAEEYLEDIYGKDWRIPNPNWVEDGSLSTCETLPKLGYYEKFRS